MPELNDPIEITADLRQDRESSWAVWTGDYADSADEAADPKEIWVFLPKSICTKTGPTTWEVPEWLAQEKGLI